MSEQTIRIILLMVALGVFAAPASPARANLLNPDSFTPQANQTTFVAPTTGSPTYTINTSATSTTATLTGPSGFNTVTVSTTNSLAPGVAVFDFTNIAISSNATIIVSGTNPLALLSQGSLTLDAGISLNGVAASGSSAGTSGPGGGGDGGAGGDKSNNGGTGNTGNGSATYTGGGGAGATKNTGDGGQGGGFGGTGGEGAGNTNTGGGTYPPNGLHDALVGGSGGGGGTATNNGSKGGGGGGGGGAIELGALTTLTIADTASVSISAKGGSGGVSNGSGGGGGSGGGILLHAGSFTGGTLNNDGTITLGATSPTTTTASFDVSGGNGGGTATNGGGGGGGGHILALAHTIHVTSVLQNIAGGSPGATGGTHGNPGDSSLPEPNSLILVGLMAGGFLVARPWRYAKTPA